MALQPYLFFDGRCEEAIAFYRKALGAEQLALLRWKDSPDPAMSAPGGDVNKVMHARFRVGDGEVLASDGRCGGAPKFEGFALSLTAKDEAEADRLFNALAEGGQVHMPLAKTFFSPSFGMLADRFGVPWMIYVPQHAAGLEVPQVSFTPALRRFLPAPCARVEGSTVAAALAAVFAANPALRGYVLDDQGALRRHVNVYVKGEPVRDRVRLADPVGPDDEIYVFQALTGG